MRTFARITTRHPRVVLAITSLAVVVSAAVGSTVIPHLSSAGYGDPNSQSSRVADLLVSDFDNESPHLTIAIGRRAEAGAAKSADVVSAAKSLTDQVSANPDVERAVSYWTTGNPPTLASRNTGLGLLLVYIDGSSLDGKNGVARKLIDELPARVGDVEVFVGGTGAVYTGINGQITDDLRKAEYLSIPLTLLMLLLVFGSAVAAAQPLIVGLSAIGVSLLGVWGVAQFTDVSVFSLNLLTGLGLGLGIDYSLLIVNRFREELARGLDVESAVARTVHTAGRTVMFSGITVALTLASMFVFPQPFLRSFAYAGLLVCFAAVGGALVPLPAALRLLGPRIDKFRIRRGSLTGSDTGAWATMARAVMRRPLITIAVTLTALLALAGLARDAVFGQVDDRVLPASHPAAIAAEVLRSDFDSNSTTPIEILLPADATSTQVAQLAKRIADTPRILHVDTPAGIYSGSAFQPLPAGWSGIKVESADYTRIRAFTSVEPRSAAAESLIDQLRSFDDRALYGGMAADYTDTQEGVANQLPIALLWVGLATLLLLFLFTGSVLLPIKAVLLNLLSLSATLGVITWMFQFGHLQWLTGEYTVTGRIDTSTLVMIILVTFGLSMDYEVFLLSRIKEEHDAGADTVDSVALGLQRSGRIITAAALLLAVVFAAFVTSSVTSIKMVGVGIAFAILLDATVVRGLLVPALMRVMGRANWWAPGWLKRVHHRFGLAD